MQNQNSSERRGRNQEMIICQENFNYSKSKKQTNVVIEPILIGFFQLLYR